MQRYIRIATYELTKGTFQEVASLAKDGMLPRFSTEPGFIEYGVADIGDHKVCSITIWETREQAEKSVHVSSTWVRETLSDRVKLLTSFVGELAFLHGAPVLA
jgi:antibiotic biosynthesis monooxygenase